MKMNLIFTCLILISISHVYGTTPVNKSRANYDPVDLLSKIFNTTEFGRANRQVQFEDTLQPISFKDYEDYIIDDDAYFKKPVKFTDDNIQENSGVKFQDVKKKRLKKKKPRQQRYPQYLGAGAHPNYRPGPVNPHFGQYYGSRPEESLASSALSRVTEALTSIALYDDRQCVARLLCEAAAGGNLGTSGILQAVSGLQPLLTLLSAYNGISTNPLFVFGRAAFLGMSSKGNTASCRYGYPLCPTDTEQLVHYLNNHNGGFFRFFNAPHLEQQNVEQLFNHLSQNSFNQGQNFIQQNVGNELYGLQQPNPYKVFNQNYGYNYGYDYNANKIQKRIQNKPLSQNVDDFQDENSKWTFPNDNHFYNNNYNIIYDNDDKNNDNLCESSHKKPKALKFPEQNKEIINEYYGNNRFSFPESQTYQSQYTTYVKPNNNLVDNNRYYTNSYYNNNNENNFQTVYVVRGNGDPNRPEIVKLRPGESVH